MFYNLCVEEVKDNQQSQKEEQVKNIIQEKVNSYLAYGQDFLLIESEFIEFYKNRYKLLAYQKNLVGNFNERGHYVIPAAIKADLVRMPKEIENMGSDFYKASNIYMKKEFYFDIKIVEVDNKAKASLYLTENVGEFLQCPHIHTHIADFIDVYDEEYRVKLRKAFNLVDVAVPISDVLVPELAVVMQDNYDFMLINEGLCDIINQIYLLKMLELLEKSGEKGVKVVERYKELAQKVEPELKGKKYKNNILKAMLDRAIDENGGLEKLEINKEDKIVTVKEINSSIKKIEGEEKKAAAVEAINTQDKAKSSKKQLEKIDKPKKKTDKKDKKKEPTAKASAPSAPWVFSDPFLGVSVGSNKTSTSSLNQASHSENKGSNLQNDTKPTAPAGTNRTFTSHSGGKEQEDVNKISLDEAIDDLVNEKFLTEAIDDRVDYGVNLSASFEDTIIEERKSLEGDATDEEKENS